MMRLGAFLGALLVVAAAPAVAVAAYWDFQGTLHDYPTVQYEYGEQNPNNGPGTYWYIRLSRSNCEAKMLFKDYSNNVLVYNIPGGCAQSDWTQPYSTSLYWASLARNTDTGPGDVYVNVRIADSP